MASAITTTAGTVPLWIAGKEETSSSSFPVISPITDRKAWDVSSASTQDAHRAVDAAQAAFPAWSAAQPVDRQAVLFRAADIMEQPERAAELAQLMRTEMGADEMTAQWLVSGPARLMREIASRVWDVSGSVPAPVEEGEGCMVWKEPYGVILGIVPWNAPYVFGVQYVATVVATGNTIVVKSSELAPRCYWALAKVFVDAGMPPGVVNVVSCRREDAATVVNAMIEHPAVKKVSFTGSAAVGRQVAQQCSKNLKPILLELGGKNCAIVLPDADLNKAAQQCLMGAFANVRRSLIDRLATCVVANQIPPGDSPARSACRQMLF
jgi:acyl-CoA reductase-like NAD-dependent aldehyde dehydrogenase